MKISDVGENTLIEIIQDLISSSESRPDFRRQENLILGIGDDAAVWNKADGEWTRLGGSYRLPIQVGIRIANDQAAPDLMVVTLEITSE